MRYLWLSNKILEWSAYYESGTTQSETKWKRAYEIWQRACDLIEKNESLFDLSDGIANLKRSLNHRLMLIEELYSLKKISFTDKPRGTLELLEKYGIVRPFIMKNLLVIRNKIEHEDTNPPEAERCKELVDVVWYFLKSTDPIVQMRKESVFFELYDNGVATQYGVSVSLEFDNSGHFELSGWFPKELISEKEQKDFFRVEVCAYNGKEKFKDSNLHADKLESDRWVSGKVSKKDESYFKVVQVILNSY